MDNADTVNVLSLFSGIGGLDLGLRLAVPSTRTVAYVEIEACCCELLATRMDEGTLDPAPICTDVGELNGGPLNGLVDIVTAGFPCQPWSLAGNRQGIGDDRWLWGHIARVIRDVRPGWVFLENVRGLLTYNKRDKQPPGIVPVAKDLARLGFVFQWGVLRATDVGAPHQRDRVFILARADHAKPLELAHTDGHGRGAGEAREPGAEMVYPPGPRGDWASYLRARPGTEPCVRRGADGVPAGLDLDWADRLHMLGNAVVPGVAALAFGELYRRLCRR